MKRLLPIALLAALAFGCSQSDPLVGTWTGSLGGQNMELRFDANGKFTQTVSTGPMTMTGSGTWKREGENLSLSPTEFKVDGMQGQMKAQVEAAAKQQMGKPQTASYKIDGNKLELKSTASASPMGGALTLMRK